jgi:RNA polymerase sigma-70 factor (ECF subfamily)
MTLRRARTDALDTAYSDHGAELYGYARRALGDDGLAEEAVQETFVRAWRARWRFDPEIATLRAWLFAILRNVIIDTARRRERHERWALDAAEPVTGDSADRVLRSWKVEEALRRLSEPHRDVLVQTYLLDRAPAEVAADLGVPVGTVHSRVFYALKNLRLALEEMGWGDE